MAGSKGKTTCILSNYEEIVKSIENLAGVEAEKAIKKCTADAKSRAPAWISAAVCEVYGIKKAEVKEALEGKGKGGGSYSIDGKVIESVALTYKGRLMTPLHFKMKPAQSKPKPYRISQEVYKGQRKNLPKGVFLASAGGAGTTQIPFQREGDSRYPIKSIKTTSVPQMIENERVKPIIEKKIDEGLSKRMNNHIKQMIAKSGG